MVSCISSASRISACKSSNVCIVEVICPFSFCNVSFFWANCNCWWVWQLENPQQRLESVNKGKHCFNCLGHHRASQCPSKLQCKLCRQKHHTSLYNAEFSKPSEPNMTPVTTQLSIYHNRERESISSAPDNSTTSASSSISDSRQWMQPLFHQNLPLHHVQILCAYWKLRLLKLE